MTVPTWKPTDRENASLFHKRTRNFIICNTQTLNKQLFISLFRYEETLFGVYSVAILLMTRALGIFQGIVPILHLGHDNNMALKKMTEPQDSFLKYMMVHILKCKENASDGEQREEGKRGREVTKMPFRDMLSLQLKPKTSSYKSSNKLESLGCICRLRMSIQ